LCLSDPSFFHPKKKKKKRSAIAKELLSVDLDAQRDSAPPEMAKLHLRGLAIHFTNANFSQKHTTRDAASAVHVQHNVRHRVASNLRQSGDFILFVNHRLVESQFLKRAGNVHPPHLSSPPLHLKRPADCDPRTKKTRQNKKKI
jgi:hypothetical protein